MNLDAKTQTRRCVLCGRDCSHVPRVRDRGGRYYCRTCHERASLALELGRDPHTRATRARPRRRKSGEVSRAAATVTGDDIKARHAPEDHPEQQAQQQPRACPGCTHQLPSDAVLCTNCGLDLRTGQRMNSPVASLASHGPASQIETARPWTLRRALLVAGLAVAALSTLAVLLLLGL